MNDKAMIPLNLQDTLSLGDVLAKSGFFSDARQASQAVVKVLAGAELGFGPIASMTGIHIVQGKPTVGANLMGAAIKGSGRYNYRVLTHTDERCEIAFYEGGQEVGRSAFSMDDATRAGLLSNPTWKKYPRNMLFSRAMSNGARWFCPDVFSGVTPYTPEEFGEHVDENGEVIDVTPTPVAEAEPIPRQPEPEPKTANGKPKVASVNSRKWGKVGAAFAQANPYYMKDDQVDWYHLTGAAAKLGFSEITDANLEEVLDALRTYANQQTGQAEMELDA